MNTMTAVIMLRAKMLQAPVASTSAMSIMSKTGCVTAGRCP